MSRPRSGGRRAAARWTLAASCALAPLGAGALASATGGVAPAGADPLADCSTTVGTVVAVDLSPWGGAVERGCDATPATGLAALQADFTVDGTAQYGDAFVCRIDGDPTVAQTACSSTPAASASWSFWYADAGDGTWTYATQGASTFRPAPGSVEAWTFGVAGAAPDFTPASVRATNASPAAPGATATTATTAPPTSPATGAVAPGPPPAGGSQVPTPTGSGTSTGGGTATPGPGPAGATATTAPGATGGAPAAAAPGATTTTTRPGGVDPTGTEPPGHGAPRIVDATPAAVHHVAPGSPVALGVGSVLVVAVGGVAGVLAWRRRRTA